MNSQPIKVLLVEDEPVYSDLVGEVLKAVSRFELTPVGRFDQALRQLGTSSFDVVLLDLSLPDRKGLATCKDLRAAFPALPIVVLTGSANETLALQAMGEGAQSYLGKGDCDGGVLPGVVGYAVERKRSEEEIALLQENLRPFAHGL